jgi:hypothetical protein
MRELFVWRAVTIYGKRLSTSDGDRPGQQTSWAKRGILYALCDSEVKLESEN